MTSDSEKRISMAKCIGKGYGKGWFTNLRTRYRIYAGARNTKKSVDILGYEVVFKILENEWVNILILRQNDTDNGGSTFPNLVSIIDEMGLTDYFLFRSNPREIIYIPTQQKITFKGFNNPTSHTSLKAFHGVYTDVYFEEGSELKSYEDFRKVDGSIRIGVSEMERYCISDSRLQLTICLNPWNKNHWIYETFFKGRLEDDVDYLESHDYADYFDPDFTLGFGKGLYLHQGTYKINEFRSPNYDENMKLLKEKSFDIYRTEALGCWGNSTEATYPEFTEDLIVPRNKALSLSYACYAIGLDFGISDGQGKVLKGDKAKVGSATTMQLVGLTSDYEKLVCLDEYYFSNETQFAKKTAPQIQSEIIQTLIKWKYELYAQHPQIMQGNTLVYVDCADSGGFRQSLELEARKQGLLDTTFIPSTKIPILSRVEFTRRLMAWGDFLFTPNCQNLMREIRNARRGDKGEIREDTNDHAINANEYAWSPMRQRIRLWKTFKPH